MANGDHLRAGMGVVATDTTLVDAALHPQTGPTLLVRSYVFRPGAPTIPTPWSTEHIGVQAEGPVGVLGLSFNSLGPGVAGIGRSAGSTGVFGSGGATAVWGNGIPSVQAGTTSFSPGSVIGVAGDSVDVAGVFGQSWFGVGVLGRNQEGGRPGVRGEGTTSGGVEGVSLDAPGVFGQSTQSHGVGGRSENGAGIDGNSRQSPGVRGFSAAAAGVLGSSEGSNGVEGFGTKGGVLGYSMGGVGVSGGTRRGPAGVLAMGSNIAFRAVSRRTAGYFEGDVVVQGDFLVLGAKSAAVPTPEGGLRQLYCVEAPEPWFEDQGEAQLMGDRADVTLDPRFVEVVRGNYQVQLTPYAPVLLWVAARQRGCFTVAAQALPGHKLPKTAIPFSWRVIARRADLARAKRFAAVKLPKLAALPDLPAEPRPEPERHASEPVQVPMPKESALGHRLATPADLAQGKRRKRAAK
ncbi:MAG TPA: hypothetical protein VIW70_15115 [Rubrivivax sp.]